ncbi:hypothetical protein [Streptomyces cadmiisoli]|uniref:hypothetical protein n=1 Tax=Streptomyces cadmiisoli TaxID=2184053 RepID=UPI001FE85E8C
MLINLTVRRLFCDNSSCGRRTFAEQVKGLTARYQRRSPMLQHLVEMAGVLLAGRGGARLLHILKAPLSRTSVLFQLMRMRLPSAPTPRVLGVDDFALYAHVYGTLLVDADTRLPIELWARRDAEQLSEWLRTHPDVKVVCRDGSLDGNWTAAPTPAKPLLQRRSRFRRRRCRRPHCPRPQSPSAPAPAGPAPP